MKKRTARARRGLLRNAKNQMDAVKFWPASTFFILHFSLEDSVDQLGPLSTVSIGDRFADGLIPWRLAGSPA